ncbi:MAG: hypothetical protein SVY10_05825 [Thermodesulfobacteriota bacterium]|nr:hypothetical protein [Thermodesulfobacteriota bacterium]
MVEKTEAEEVVSFEEIVVSDMLTLEALVSLLEKKGIITRDELTKERIEVSTEMLDAEKTK